MPKPDFYSYVSNLAAVHNAPWMIRVYQEDCYFVWSKKYPDLNPYFMLNIGYAESRYCNWAISSAGARGTWQIKPDMWDFLLWYIDSGKLEGRHNLNVLTFEQRSKLFNVVYYNFEMACSIIHLMKKKWGSYELALLAYRYGDAPGNADFNYYRAHMNEWRASEYYLFCFNEGYLNARVKRKD